MLWAAACLCFFGFLRSGEIVCPTGFSFDLQAYLAFSDVAVDDRSAPSALRVQIKASKTDLFRQGAHWDDRRRALPCDSTTPLHGSQGRRPRPAIHMGGPPFPHTENLRDGSTGSANQRGLPRCRLCGSQLQNRRRDYSAGCRNPSSKPSAAGRAVRIPGSMYRTRVLTTDCEESRERSRKLIDLSCT